jgi:hypothetical protein
MNVLSIVETPEKYPAMVSWQRAQIVSVRQCDETFGRKPSHADIRSTTKLCQTAAPELPLITKLTPAPMKVGQFPTDRKKKALCIMLRTQRIPESLRAFWRMVSFTAAKTSRMFDVSVACVRL